MISSGRMMIAPGGAEPSPGDDARASWQDSWQESWEAQFSATALDPERSCGRRSTVSWEDELTSDNELSRDNELPPVLVLTDGDQPRREGATIAWEDEFSPPLPPRRTRNRAAYRVLNDRTSNDT
jgi:hypothetical protein